MVGGRGQPVPRSGKLSVPVPQIEKWVPDFEPIKGEQEHISSLLQQATNNETDPPIVLLNPNASDLLPLRKWPVERYVSLAQRLLEAFTEIYIGFTVTPHESGPIEGMVLEIESPRCYS